MSQWDVKIELGNLAQVRRHSPDSEIAGAMSV